MKFVRALALLALIEAAPESAQAQEETEKAPGRIHFTLGAPVVPGGIYAAYNLEMAKWRFGLTFVGTGAFGDSGTGAGFFGADVAYSFSDGPSSPFVGVGVGQVGVDDLAGVGGHLEAGMEMLRLHRMRLIVAGDVIIPAYDSRKGNRFADAKRVYASLQLRVRF